jgi:hypothetical protein
MERIVSPNDDTAKHGFSLVEAFFRWGIGVNSATAICLQRGFQLFEQPQTVLDVAW